VNILHRDAANRGATFGGFTSLDAGRAGFVRHLARVILALLLLVAFVLDLDTKEFHGDKSHWPTSSQLAFESFASRDLTSDLWRGKLNIVSATADWKVGNRRVACSQWDCRPD
jgi:hypothetical protein